MRPGIASESGAHHARFDDLSDCPRRHTRTDRAVAIDAPKDAPLGELGRGKPRCHRAYRTLRRLRRERRGDAFAFAFFVALRAADRDDSGIGPVMQPVISVKIG